jgi:transcriptional regulator with XRE-family HTH domain
MARADAGLTISELAKRAGVSRDTISNAERGLHSLQTPTLNKIAHALGKRPSELLAEEERLAPKVPRRSPSEPSFNDALEEERRRTYLEAFFKEVRGCTDDAQAFARSLKEVLQDQEVARAGQLLAETGRRVQTCQRVFWPLVNEGESLPEWEHELAWALVEEHLRLWSALRVIRDRMEADDRTRRVLTEVADQFEQLENLVRHESG